jgi:hypothetical protein
LQAEASFLDKTEVPPTYAVLARVSPGYPPLLGRLPTCYSPVRRSPETEVPFAHDLHVLSTPPAFILSQDQTLQFRSFRLPGGLAPGRRFIRNPLPAPPTPRRAPRARKHAADFTLPLSGFQRTDAVPFLEANPDSNHLPARLSSPGEGWLAVQPATATAYSRVAPPAYCPSRNLPADSRAVPSPERGCQGRRILLPRFAAVNPPFASRLFPLG